MRNWCEGWVLGGVGGQSQNLTLISNWLEAHWAVFMQFLVISCAFLDLLPFHVHDRALFLLSCCFVQY